MKKGTKRKMNYHKYIVIVFILFMTVGFITSACIKWSEDSLRKQYPIHYIVNSEVVFDYAVNLGDGMVARGRCANEIDLSTVTNKYQELYIEMIPYSTGPCEVMIIRGNDTLINQTYLFKCLLIDGEWHQHQLRISSY